MTPEELLRHFQHRPFQAFRLYLTDGSSYDIRYPELCMPGRRSVFIGITEGPELVYDDWAMVDLIHITRLEPLEVPTPPTGNGAGG